MSVMLMNKKMVKKNKSVKKIMKSSLKGYGKVKGAVIKGKIGKLSVCTEFQQDPDLAGKGFDNFEITKDELLDLLKTAGLKGFGAGFPVYEKLLTFINSTVNNTDKLFIINGVECEPGLFTDQMLINNYFSRINQGIKIIAKALGLSKVVFASKSFPEGSASDYCNLQKVPYKYPMGEEHVLIEQVTGKKLNKNEIPAANGILILNVQTVYAIYKLVSKICITGRYITITNNANAESKVAFIKEGESICAKYEEMFGKLQDGQKLYTGIGAFAVDKLNKDTYDMTIAYVCATKEVCISSNKNPCKGCGACQAACPMKVKIKKVVAMCEKGQEKSGFVGLNVENCIHCNTCSYVCAANKLPYTYFSK